MQITQSAASPSLAEWRQLLDELYHDRKLWTFKRGEAIPLKEEDVWVVCRGVVQLSTLYPSGDEGILGLACASMPFGRPFTQVNPYEAVALSDVVLMRLHHMELEQSPRLAQSLMREMGRRIQQTEALLAMAGCRRVKDRLRQLILLLQQELGHVTPEGIKLSIKLTHQQLASMIGTTRVTVTRLLMELKDEGLQI
ncbi:Crp/Fnr family transcriptional regulator [Lyngbya confervoides]|uniref:Crp/Fnr family transcriptional regulator n=1 Tax=Lyngbya confervoides BDU141951 TaxID=1574623 RepID=A0ABD4SYB3_9CYAN|nr:Crp/Fnr family transcriptional regulator [Lyngbya confervoides]MCM1981314.1 Crp/Fnr family transcriptional regulator [Lyngbya confervoides BDU141951]